MWWPGGSALRLQEAPERPESDPKALIFKPVLVVSRRELLSIVFSGDERPVLQWEPFNLLQTEREKLSKRHLEAFSEHVFACGTPPDAVSKGEIEVGSTYQPGRPCQTGGDIIDVAPARLLGARRDLHPVRPACATQVRRLISPFYMIS